MKRLGKKFFSLLFLSLLVLLTITSLASADTKVIANTKDWKSIYLLSIYAKYLDADVIFFNNLADSQLKTKMISVDDSVLVFESTVDPVIKKYSSLLKVNGYNDYTTFSFSDYSDLQEFLVSDLDVSGYYIMDPNYGLDSIASTTFVLSNNYFPLYLTEENIDFISKLSLQKPSYIVGRTPVRLLDKVTGTQIQGFPFETLHESTKLSIDSVDSSWGIIMRADTVDLDLLVKGLPIFVYHADEYIDEVAESVRTSDISKFEVVGASAADIAKEIEVQSQKNLDFMLKYGRKVTNYPGLSGDILDIDSVSFDYPVESLIIEKAVHYPNLGVLALTFKNTGNTNVLFFSNVEFANEPLSDNNTHSVAVGEVKTIPFELTSKGLSGEEVRVSTRYGSSLPLKFSISGDPGNLFYESNVLTNDLSQNLYEVDLVSSGFDTERGILELVFKNPYPEPLMIFSELLIGESDVVSSSTIQIDPKGKQTVFIKTPYIRDEDLLEQEFPLVTYIGYSDTISKYESTILIQKKVNYTSSIFIVGAVLLVIVLLLLLFFVFKRRKNNGSKSSKKKTSKNSKKK